MNQMDGNLNDLLSSPQNVDLPQTFRSSILSSFVLIHINTMAYALWLQMPGPRPRHRAHWARDLVGIMSGAWWVSLCQGPVWSPVQGTGGQMKIYNSIP